MAKISKVYVSPIQPVRVIHPGFDFVFSSDLDLWMYSKKLKHAQKQRDYDRGKDRQARIR